MLLLFYLRVWWFGCFWFFFSVKERFSSLYEFPGTGALLHRLPAAVPRGWSESSSASSERAHQRAGASVLETLCVAAGYKGVQKFCEHGCP